MVRPRPLRRRYLALWFWPLCLAGQTPPQLSNILERLDRLEQENRSLTEDIAPLLPTGATFSDDEAIPAFERIWFELISRIKGDPWKLSLRTIEKVQRVKFPTFLQRNTT